MANKRAIKKLLTILILATFCFEEGHSQCINQVTHLTGTASIQGVNVSVTSFGVVDTFYSYCPNTFPYFIGYHQPSTGGTGSYSFTFSPPIDSLTLNFSGITNISGHQEIVKLYINGNHYSIPAVGTANGCDTMSMLLPSGDITGCNSCNVSGWNGTTIIGSISSLTVLDTLNIGLNSGGSLFSLFISKSGFSGLSSPESVPKIYFYPNPFSNQLTFEYLNNKQAIISLYDFLGRQIFQQAFNNSITINTEQFPGGIYFYKLTNSGEQISCGKLIKN
jgi:hypothetical protein